VRYTYRKIVSLEDWENFGGLVMRECMKEMRTQVGPWTEPGRCTYSYLRFAWEQGKDGEYHMVERYCTRADATHMALDWRWEGASRDSA